MKYHKSLYLKFFCVYTVAVLFCASCGKSDNKATTMYLVKTDGDVSVEDADGKSVALIDNLGLYSGYGLGTQADSFAWIDLDATKLAKMDEESNVGITKAGRELEIFVNSGSLFFNVTEPLADDESMDIHTSTMTCGIRGTCGWVMADGGTSSLTLLDGTVECIILVDGQEETVTVNAKESLIVEEDDGNVTYEMVPLIFDAVPEFVQEEVVNELFAMEENSDNNGQSGESGTQTEDDASVNPENDTETPSDGEGVSQEEQESEDDDAPQEEQTSEDDDASQKEQAPEAETGEAAPGEEIGFFDATGLYVLENNRNTDEVTLSLEAYTDDINGGPLRIYIGQSTMFFDGEWVLSDDEDSFRGGVAYNATDSNGNTLSFVLDAEATGVTITSADDDGFNSIEGHYVIQRRYEAP